MLNIDSLPQRSFPSATFSSTNSTRILNIIVYHKGQLTAIYKPLETACRKASLVPHVTRQNAMQRATPSCTFDLASSTPRCSANTSPNQAPETPPSFALEVVCDVSENIVRQILNVIQVGWRSITTSRKSFADIVNPSNRR